MAIGFFVAISSAELRDERVSAAFVGRTLWELDGGGREIELQGRNWRVVCMQDGGSGGSVLWKESGRPEFQGSFVFLQGWCYRISHSSETLSVADYREIIARFSADQPPLSDDFGGQFVAVVYDARRKRLAVQPDRLAVGAAFFAGAGGEMAASNRALRLANYFGSALDGQSVLAQMRGAEMPFGRTLFAGVHRLMGSTYLEFDLAAGRGQVKKPHSPFVAIREISYADSVEVVTNTVRSAVRRVLAEGPVRFDLTGGNDTRVIASAVENLTRSNGHHKFGFRVTDPEGSSDVNVARRIADSCGWPLLRMDRHHAAQPAAEELGRAATTSDGNFPVNVVWERVHFERVSQHAEWKTQVGAPAGELFRGFFYAQEMLALGRSSHVNYDALLAYRTYASRGTNLKIFGSGRPTFEAHDQMLLAPYRAIGEEGGLLPNPYKLDVMYLQRHCYRSGNSLSGLAGLLNVRLPFLSWELAGLGLSLPWKYRANRGLVQRVIGKLSPKLASFPTEEGEPMKPLSAATLPAYVASKIPIQVDRARRVARRLFGQSGGVKKAGFPIPKAGYLAVLDEARALQTIFDPAVVRQVRAQVASEENSRDAATMFYVLCSIELLLREAPRLRHAVVFD
jgi:hypothetical protein